MFKVEWNDGKKSGRYKEKNCSLQNPVGSDHERNCSTFSKIFQFYFRFNKRKFQVNCKLNENTNKKSCISRVWNFFCTYIVFRSNERRYLLSLKIEKSKQRWINNPASKTNGRTQQRWKINLHLLSQLSNMFIYCLLLLFGNIYIEHRIWCCPFHEVSHAVARLHISVFRVT